VTFWDATNGRNIGALRVRRQRAVGVLSMAFSPDGRTVAIAPIGTNPDKEGALDGQDFDDLELWDVRAQRWIRTVSGAGSGDLIFEPDGRRLFVDRTSKGRILVDTATGEILQHASDARTAGKILFIENMAAIGDADGRLTFWDRTLRRRLSPPLRARSTPVDALVPYPPGRLLATVLDEGQYGIQLWDWRGYQGIAAPISYATLSVQGSYATRSAVPAVAFNRTALLISFADGALREITVDPDTAAAAICRRDGDLSPAEWQEHIPELAYRKTCR
jgi:WD40 repeat protein